jgi:aryl-alcohol dehydrogenase-like predicted oxidoreductase
MDARRLGNSSLRVSPVIFGAWAIGGWMWGGADEKDAIEAIHAALDNGITTIDTAAVYGFGRSEELVGKAIKGRLREQVIIATKCGMRWDSDEGSDPWPQTGPDGQPVVIRKNSRPDSIIHECEKSLKRLGVETIDLYQIHWADLSTPVEDSMAAMLKLKDQGKIRAIGVSNYPIDLLERAFKAAPLASVQPPYSVIRRGIEADIIPFCRRHNVSPIVYSPLERGLLTGHVGPDRTFAPGDHRATLKSFSVDNRKRIMAALERIRPLAEQHHASFAQLIINWTYNEPGITAALVGARNAQQAEHNARAMDLNLTTRERGMIRAVFDEASRVVLA